MTGSRSILLSFQKLHGGTILFGNRGTSQIVGKGNMKITDKVKINDVSLVEDLGYNLLSISQLCDQGNNEVHFSTIDVKVVNPHKDVLLRGKRNGRSYIFDYTSPMLSSICLSTLLADTQLWHKRFGHASLHTLAKLHSKGLVKGLPLVKVDDMTSCDACSKGKMTRSSFPSKKIVSTSSPLELIHIDLCGPMRIQSYGGNRYMFVLVDDYSRFTWTLFLRS